MAIWSRLRAPFRDDANTIGGIALQAERLDNGGAFLKGRPGIQGSPFFVDIPATVGCREQHGDAIGRFRSCTYRGAPTTTLPLAYSDEYPGTLRPTGRNVGVTGYRGPPGSSDFPPQAKRLRGSQKKKKCEVR